MSDLTALPQIDYVDYDGTVKKDKKNLLPSYF